MIAFAVPVYRQTETAEAYVYEKVLSYEVSADHINPRNGQPFSIQHLRCEIHHQAARMPCLFIATEHGTRMLHCAPLGEEYIKYDYTAGMFCKNEDVHRQFCTDEDEHVLLRHLSSILIKSDSDYQAPTIQQMHADCLYIPKEIKKCYAFHDLKFIRKQQQRCLFKIIRDVTMMQDASKSSAPMPATPTSARLVVES